MGTTPADTGAPVRHPSDLEYAAHQIANGIAKLSPPATLADARVEREKAIARFFNRLADLTTEATGFLKQMMQAELEERAAARDRQARYRQPAN